MESSNQLDKWVWSLGERSGLISQNGESSVYLPSETKGMDKIIQVCKAGEL